MITDNEQNTPEDEEHDPLNEAREEELPDHPSDEEFESRMENSLTRSLNQKEEEFDPQEFAPKDLSPYEELLLKTEQEEEEKRKMAQAAAQFQQDNDQGTDNNEQQAAAPEAAQEQLQEMEEKVMRMAAEMQNLRRRTERDVKDARQYAVSSFANDVIGVIENLRRAEKSIPEEELGKNDFLKSIFEGVVMTRDELLSIFERHGIKRIKPTPGDDFDHQLHEAVAHVESQEFDAGNVVDVMESGFVIHDRLLKPAIVAVAKAGSVATPTQVEESVIEEEELAEVALTEQTLDSDATTEEHDEDDIHEESDETSSDEQGSQTPLKKSKKKAANDQA